MEPAVDDIIVHPEWSTKSRLYDADIAIIVFKEEIEFTLFISPLCLSPPKEQSEINGQEGFVAGWGDMSLAHPKFIKMKMVSNVVCVDSDPRYHGLASERTFCAIGRNGEGPCRGDGGSPLITRIDGHWFLRGIASTAFIDLTTGTCDVGNYSIFSNVDKFSDWLQIYISASNSSDTS